MKRLTFLFFIAVIAMAFGSTAKANYHTVTVTLINGESMSYSISDELTVRFNDLEMTIASPDLQNTVVIPKENISEFVHSTAGINDISNDSNAPTIANGILNFKNLPEGSIISIINTSGQVIKSITASGEFELSLDILPTGIYVVTVNNSTFKIAVK